MKLEIGKNKSYVELWIEQIFLMIGNKKVRKREFSIKNYSAGMKVFIDFCYDICDRDFM